MIVTEINKVFSTFCSSGNTSSSLLIDGKYGCGKTFNVIHQIDKLKCDYFYISLFGIDSTNALMARLGEKLNNNEIVKVNGSLIFREVPIPNKYNGFIFIFDDLERLSTSNFKYKTLYGAFDSLIKIGFKIICIVNSEALNNNDDYLDFRDKIFDRIVNVKADYRELPNIITNCKISPNRAILGDANDNWRIVIKSYDIVQEFLDYLKKNNYIDFNKRAKTDEMSLFRSCVIANKCIFNNTQYVPHFKDNDMAKYQYEIDIQNLGEKEANALYQTFLERGENVTLKHLVRLFICAIRAYDYSLITAEYYSSDFKDPLTSRPPFDEMLFYLDDSGKKKYKETFINHINEFDFSNKAHMNIASNVISYFIDTFTDLEKNLIEQRIVDTMSPKELGNLYLQIGADNKTKNKLISLFKEEVNEKMKRKKHNNSKNEIENAYAKKDYAQLIDYLYKNNYVGNVDGDLIASVFANENFFLPDLSKRITPTEWSYCHEIARFISKYDSYAEKFLEILKTQCINSNSTTLKERCKALVKYNFNDTKYSNYDLGIKDEWF